MGDVFLSGVREIVQVASLNVLIWKGTIKSTAKLTDSAVSSKVLGANL